MNTLIIGKWGRRTVSPRTLCRPYEGYLRAAFTPPLNLYQSDLFERTQRRRFGTGLPVHTGDDYFAVRRARLEVAGD